MRELGPFESVTIDGDGCVRAGGAEIGRFAFERDRWVFNDFLATDFVFGNRVTAVLRDGSAREFGPFRILQMTYEMLRVDPDGDRELAILRQGSHLWDGFGVEPGASIEPYAAIILRPAGDEASTAEAAA
jgi:hypothetical protein